jgi:hypothetical protein
MKPKRKIVPSATPQRSVFTNYACNAGNEHIYRNSALDTDLLADLAQFLKTDVLSWVEHLAMHANLETI